MNPANPRYDVAVIGAGVAGLAASVFLRQEGLTVVCLDAAPHPHHKVGESLDWSSPGLLKRLGIAADGLLASGIATPKRKIVVHELGREAWGAAPPAEIRREPLRFETETLHVDRTALDLAIYERALSLGTTFLWERVTTLAVDGERVLSCTTTSGRSVEARWFIDATGSARLFARSMQIPVTTYGRHKVCLWTYFETPPLADGTVFFVDNDEPYLRWVWDIPITPRQTSVGYVLPADSMRDQVRVGHTVESILRDELRRHGRFDALLLASPALKVETTSFQPFVTETVCGANWLMVGECASMPDPLTGNGVTSGIRHARHACAAIRVAGENDALTARQRRSYEQHIFRLGRAFNAHIEHAIYQPQIRWGFGLKMATYVYTLFAFFMNALHARFDPRGRAGMAVFAVLFSGARVWIAAWVLAGRVARRVRPARRPPGSRAARTPGRPAPPGADDDAGAEAPA